MGTFANSEMQHFLRVYTVCYGKKDLEYWVSDKKYNFF